MIVAARKALEGSSSASHREQQKLAQSAFPIANEALQLGMEHTLVVGNTQVFMKDGAYDVLMALSSRGKAIASLSAHMSEMGFGAVKAAQIHKLNAIISVAFDLQCVQASITVCKQIFPNARGCSLIKQAQSLLQQHTTKFAIRLQAYERGERVRRRAFKQYAEFLARIKATNAIHEARDKITQMEHEPYRDPLQALLTDGKELPFADPSLPEVCTVNLVVRGQLPQLLKKMDQLDEVKQMFTEVLATNPLDEDAGPVELKLLEETSRRIRDGLDTLMEVGVDNDVDMVFNAKTRMKRFEMVVTQAQALKDILDTNPLETAEDFPLEVTTKDLTSIVTQLTEALERAAAFGMDKRFDAVSKARHELEIMQTRVQHLALLAAQPSVDLSEIGEQEPITTAELTARADALEQALRRADELDLECVNAVKTAQKHSDDIFYVIQHAAVMQKCLDLNPLAKEDSDVGAVTTDDVNKAIQDLKLAIDRSDELGMATAMVVSKEAVKLRSSLEPVLGQCQLLQETLDTDPLRKAAQDASIEVQTSDLSAMVTRVSDCLKTAEALQMGASFEVMVKARAALTQMEAQVAHLFVLEEQTAIDLTDTSDDKPLETAVLTARAEALKEALVTADTLGLERLGVVKQAKAHLKDVWGTVEHALELERCLDNNPLDNNSSATIEVVDFKLAIEELEEAINHGEELGLIYVLLIVLAFTH